MCPGEERVGCCPGRRPQSAVLHQHRSPLREASSLPPWVSCYPSSPWCLPVVRTLQTLPPHPGSPVPRGCHLSGGERLVCSFWVSPQLLGEPSPLPLVTRSLHFRSCFLLGCSRCSALEKLRCSPLLPTPTGLCGLVAGPFIPQLCLLLSVFVLKKYLHMCTYTHTHACTRMHMHTRACTQKQAHMHTHAHTNIHTCGCTGMLTTTLLEIVRKRKPYTLGSLCSHQP